MSVRLAVFDCDGTLVDGQAAVVQAMLAAFAAVGLAAPSAHAVRRIVGLSLTQAMARLAPAASAAQNAALVESYKQAFRAAREAGELVEPLYPGIRPLLDSLRAGRWRWPPAKAGAGWTIAWPCMACRPISAACKPPTITPPSRIPQCWRPRWTNAWPSRQRQ